VRWCPSTLRAFLRARASHSWRFPFPFAFHVAPVRRTGAPLLRACAAVACQENRGGVGRADVASRTWRRGGREGAGADGQRLMLIRGVLKKQVTIHNSPPPKNLTSLHILYPTIPSCLTCVLVRVYLVDFQE
jgi:hypothetical protein